MKKRKIDKKWDMQYYSKHNIDIFHNFKTINELPFLWIKINWFRKF